MLDQSKAIWRYVFFVTTTDPNSAKHPVWVLYDEQRTARLNVKYLQAQLRRLTRWNLFHEILIAVSTSSAVAGFSFWENAFGGYLWKIIGAIATVASILKPILQLSEKMKRKQELLASYNILDHDLNRIGLEVRHRNKYDEALRRQFRKALERKAELVKQDVESDVDERLRRKSREAVEKELPAASFHIPPE